MTRWRALMVLGTAQFLMVLDTSVMNVSISQLVEDFDTEVTAIQAVITLYALVMAAFMIIGGRLGDIFGRRRLFFLGLVVYATGSALTAAAPTLWVLALGWSVIEGLGAAMVLPAMAALVAESYRGPGPCRGLRRHRGSGRGGHRRRSASGRLGDDVPHLEAGLRRRGRGRAGRAVLPARDHGHPAHRTAPRLDGVGAALSATGLALGVLGVLQSSTWGWVQPRNPPFTVLRLLTHTLRRRRGSGRARPLRALGAAQGGPRAANRWCI